MKTEETQSSTESIMDMGLNTREKNKFNKKFVLWNTISLLLFFLMFANTFFCSLLLYNYSISNQETQMLLRSLMTKLQPDSSHNYESNNFNPTVGMELPLTLNYFPDFGRKYTQKFDKFSTTVGGDCPTCPICDPTIEVPKNKDPVSLVNNAYVERATYKCHVACRVPFIHVSRLTIDGIVDTWEGRGDTEERAKQEAAYKALSEIHPDLAELAHSSGFESEDYQPKCLRPPHSTARDPEKC